MTDWPKSYRRGSTIFKEVLKKGKLDYYLCVVCGDKYFPRHYQSDTEGHEIMHLLQQLRANFETKELVMQE